MCMDDVGAWACACTCCAATSLSIEWCRDEYPSSMATGTALGGEGGRRKLCGEVRCDDVRL